MVNFGILGSGDVGKAIGKGLIAAGHHVKVGTRSPQEQKIKDWVTQNGPNASVGSNQEAVAFGEVIVLAPNWNGTESSINLAGKANFKGKVVLDVTNPVNGGPKGCDLIPGVNGGKTVQEWIPEAKVVKFLNTVGHSLMVQPPPQDSVKPITFICGNDAEAKKFATGVLNSFGWEVVIDAGGIERSTYLEALAPLWVNYAFSHPEARWHHNWAFLK